MHTCERGIAGRVRPSNRPPILLVATFLAFTSCSQAVRPTILVLDFDTEERAGQAAQWLFSPRLLDPAGTRHSGSQGGAAVLPEALFFLKQVDVSALRLASFEDEAADAAADRLLDKLDPATPSNHAYRHYYIHRAAAYARGHAPAERVGIRVERDLSLSAGVSGSVLALDRADGSDPSVEASVDEIIERLALVSLPEAGDLRRAGGDEPERLHIRIRGGGKTLGEWRVAPAGAGAGEAASADEGSGDSGGAAAERRGVNSRGAVEQGRGTVTELAEEEWLDISGYEGPDVQATAERKGTRFDLLVVHAGRVDSPDQRGELLEAGKSLFSGHEHPGRADFARRSDRADFAGRSGGQNRFDTPYRLALPQQPESGEGQLPHPFEPAGEYLEALFRGDYDLALLRWESESGSELEVLRMFREYDPRNYAQWQDGEYTRLVDEATRDGGTPRADGDPAAEAQRPATEAQRPATEAWEMLREAGVVVPLAREKHQLGYSVYYGDAGEQAVSKLQVELTALGMPVLRW